MGDVDFIIQLLEELSAFNSSNELYYSVFSIEQLLKNRCNLFCNLAGHKLKQILNFTSSISDSLGEFTGDKIKLQELVLNLLKKCRGSHHRTRLHSSGSFPQRRYHYHHLYRYRLRNHSGADGMYLPAICHLQTGRNRTWTGILPQDCRGSRRNSHCCFHSAGIHYIYRYTSCLGTFLP